MTYAGSWKAESGELSNSGVRGQCSWSPLRIHWAVQRQSQSEFFLMLSVIFRLAQSSTFINIITSRDVFMFTFSLLCYFLASVHPQASSHLTMTTGWQTPSCKWEHFYSFLHSTPTPLAPDAFCYSHMVLGMENFCSYQIGPTNHLKTCGNHITAASLVFFLIF